MATLGDLTQLRAQRAGRLQVHLAWMAAGGPWPPGPWQRRAGVTLDDIYVVPDVQARAHGVVEADRAAEERAALGPADEAAGARLPWGTVWRGVRRAVVLGRAGEGKSTLLQWTSRQVARESLARWHAQTTPLDEIPVPVVVKAAAIMEAGSVAQAIAGGASRPGGARPVSPPGGLTADELAAALDRESSWLFVDALDERPSTEEVASGRVRPALATVGGVRARLLVSMRSYAWDPTLLPFDAVAVEPAPPASAERAGARGPGPVTPPAAGGPVVSAADAIVIYELAKLTRAQREAVVARWHRGAAAARRRRQLMGVLDVAPMVELTNNALLLTLLCAATLVAGRRVTPATRRAELYAWLVHDFVARPDDERLDLPDDEVDERLAILTRAAWALWQMTQGGDFTAQQWRAQVEAAAAGGPRAAAGQLLRQLEAAGVVVKIGARMNFFPQTLFEYLAGVGLVQRAAVQPRIAPDAVEGIVSELRAYGAAGGWRELFTLALGIWRWSSVGAT